MNQTFTQETKNKVEIIKSQLPLVLENYKKYFIFFHKNPEVAEYQQFYVQYKSQLEQLNTQLGDINKSIDLNINKLNKLTGVANYELKDKKTEFAELIQNFEHYKQTLDGAEQMIDDYKTLYNKQYYKNVQLLVGIIVTIILIGKLMNKK